MSNGNGGNVAVVAASVKFSLPQLEFTEDVVKLPLIELPDGVEPILFQSAPSKYAQSIVEIS